MKQPCNTALYYRLSRDDENFGDSVSIETQRTILQQYARDNNFYVVDEYIDDGWSGTNFDRPAFQRMMDDVDAGRINCIITKDLSRFGREHVMMDYYLEFVFPEKHIRYIAVTENEDTEKGLSDFVPFKNLFNEWFAKDTSRKVKATLRAKHAAGQRTCTYAPLGYKKHPEIKNAIVVDEETKWIIEKIFELAYHGSGAASIALIIEKVPTSGWLNYTRYGTFAHIYAEAPEEKQYDWSIGQVKDILRDETYIGNSVHNKQSNISYKNKKKVRKPKEEWLRIENTHEAIISKDVFDRVQEQIASRRRKQKDGTTMPRLRLVTRLWGKSTEQNALRSLSLQQVWARHWKCSMHYIRYDTLYTYVLLRIQYWAQQAQLGEEQLLQQLLKAGDKERAAAVKKQTAELNKVEKRKAEVDRLFVKMYEDRVSERITEQNFQMLSQKYQAEQMELDKKIQKLKAELATNKQTVTDAEKWIELIKKYANPTELTAELLNTLVEKIVVYEAVKLANGFREQEIAIYYRFVGKID